MSFPKLPGGPIPQGSAAVRGLEAQGATWQTKWGGDYVARVKDGFSRVEGGEDKFTTYGPLNETDGWRNFGTRDYMRPFKGSYSGAGMNCDYGLSAFNANVSAVTVYSSGSYPGAYAGLTTSVTSSYYKSTDYLLIGTTITSAAATVSIVTHTLLANNAYLNLYPTRGDYDYWGRVDIGQGNEPKIVVTYCADMGRVDSAGRKMLDPLLGYVYQKSDPVTYYVPLPTDGERDFLSPSTLVSSQYIYILVAENFVRYGTVSTSVDVRPPLWLLFSSDGGSSFTRVDIRGAILNDLDMPKHRVAKFTTSGPGGAAGFFNNDTIDLDNGTTNIIDTVNYSHVQDYAVTVDPLVLNTRELNSFVFTDGYKYNANLTFIIYGGRWVMGIDHVAVRSFPYRKTVGGSYVWASKIVRFVGATASVVYTSATSVYLTEFIEDIIHIGGGIMLAKKSAGFGGINFNVTMMRSTDNGQTWTEFTPVGFACPLKNQYFGEFALAKPLTDGESRVLINSWDMETQSYYLFSTIDAGATWVKGGKIGTPDAFQRIDTMLSGDGGGNFNNILPVNGQLRKYSVDPALPTRYVRTPA